MASECDPNCSHEHECEHEHVMAIIQYLACTEDTQEIITYMRELRDVAEDAPVSVRVFLSYIIDALSTVMMIHESREEARQIQERRERSQYN